DVSHQCRARGRFASFPTINAPSWYAFSADSYRVQPRHCHGGADIAGVCELCGRTEALPVAARGRCRCHRWNGNSVTSIASDAEMRIADASVLPMGPSILRAWGTNAAPNEATIGDPPIRSRANTPGDST